ncbi:hypothetical protein [Streptomyces olivaceiscleroticus]|uniref:Uncharacterized protein n=1 Tax=Streptomyces olivaceiscleroticus TaxID=68245 RepID=A0ABN0ZPB4_9ACTN
MTASAPWQDPPPRKKPLRRRRAEKQARQAAHWGQRLEEAAKEGPDMVAAVTFDRLRGALDRLPNQGRERAFEDLIQTLDTFRETHAQ